jgi:uncharacterized protein
MRTLALFLALILFALVAMAGLTYPVWEWLHPRYGFPFHRVADRIGMLALALGCVLLARPLGLTNRASLGYGVPRARFARELAIGFAVGAPAMAAVIALMAALHLRTWKPGIMLDATTLLGIAGTGLQRGFAVAFIEETFLRGAVFSGVQRESGTRTAIVATSILFAISHFVGQFHIPAAEVNAASGLALLGGSLRAFAHPLAIADAFLCLTAVGVVLGLVRAWTGQIGGCIGLHASWVWVITFAREATQPDPTSPLHFLLSRFDGVVGWLVLAWTVLIGAALHALYSRRARVAGASAQSG